MKTLHCTSTILLIWILSFSPISLSGQDTTFYDDDWKKVKSREKATYYGFFEKEEGNWILRDYYVSTGNLQSKGAYKTKKKKISVGLWTYYFENGQKEKEITFVDDIYEGRYAEWYENGNPKKLGNYVAGNRMGFWEAWYEDNQKNYELEYTGQAFNEIHNVWAKDGSPMVIEGTGKFIQYFEDGTVKVEGEVKNKLREGEFLVYYPSGALLEKVYFEENKAEGTHIYFYENGQMESKGIEKANFPLGIWTYYQQDGSVSFVKNFHPESRSQSAKPYAIGSREPIPVNVGQIKKMIGYPQAALKRNLQGEVICRVLLDKDGKYLKHKMISSTSPIFRRAVEKHIDKVKFTYALERNQSIKFWVNIPFYFKLI